MAASDKLFSLRDSRRGHLGLGDFQNKKHILGLRRKGVAKFGINAKQTLEWYPRANYPGFFVVLTFLREYVAGNVTFLCMCSQKMLEKVNWEGLGASLGGLEASWASLGRPGSSLGRLAEVLGLLGNVLGRSG